MNIQRNALLQKQQALRSAAKSSSGKGNGYIIMPPAANSIFKSEANAAATLDSVGVGQREELSILGGYLAELSPEQVKEMEKKGFRLFKDSVHNYIPNSEPVDLNQVAEGAINKAMSKAAEEGDADPSKGHSNFVPRAELTDSRWNSTIENNFRAKGVTIAVLDSGVNPHPDFGDRLIGQIDFVNGHTLAYDDNGHGTHVAGDAAGSGALDPRFAGPASEANIISMKVLSGAGSGSTSDIVKAIQTAVELKDELNIRVINMSLGGPAGKDGENDPINQAIKAAKEAGIWIAVAAGNDGPERKTVGSPGNSLHATTVGAIDDQNTKDPSDDVPASFSSRGPTPDGVTKPDIMAPGVSIMAPLAMGSQSAERARAMQSMHQSIQYLDNLPFDMLQNAPNALFNQIGISDATAEKIKLMEPISDIVFEQLLKATSRTPIDETGAYQGMPGTSMATPIVAGVGAQLIGANPDLTPDQVHDILTSTANPLPDKRYKANTQGAGVVDPQEAIMKALSTEGERNKAPEIILDGEAGLAELGLSLEDILAGPDAPTEEPAEEPKEDK